MHVFYVLHGKVNGFRSLFCLISNNLPLIVCMLSFVCVCVQASRCVCMHFFFFFQRLNSNAWFPFSVHFPWAAPLMQLPVQAGDEPPHLRLSSFRLMSCRCADASILRSQWSRHSLWLGAGRGLLWSAAICLGQRVFWYWAPGILQYVLMLLTHNVLCNAVFIMMHLWYWDVCAFYRCGNHFLHFSSVRSFRPLFTSSRD